MDKFYIYAGERSIMAAHNRNGNVNNVLRMQWDEGREVWPIVTRFDALGAHVALGEIFRQFARSLPCNFTAEFINEEGDVVYNETCSPPASRLIPAINFRVYCGIVDFREWIEGYLNGNSVVTHVVTSSTSQGELCDVLPIERYV